MNLKHLTTDKLIELIWILRNFKLYELEAELTKRKRGKEVIK